MQVFVRVIETGGLSAAGRALGLAPSSVSRRVAELEHALGVRLLHRTTRKLSLTEAGETYYERARDILRAIDEANLAVTETRAGPSGVLRVTAPTSVARQHVAPTVAAFQRQYGAVQVVLLVTDRMADIVSEGLDVALRVGPLEDTRLIARKICEARRLVCASPAYLAASGEPKHPSDLADHACATFRSHAGINLWRFRRGAERIEVRATGAFFSDDGETLAAAARAGLGVVLLPEWLVGTDIGAGRLVELLGDFTPEPAATALYAVYPPGPYLPPKVRAFIDFLAGRFSRDYDWSRET